jgi:hypothetical protein
MILLATVGKIIMPSGSSDTEKVELSIQDGTGPLHSQIRVENHFTDEKGQLVKLKESAAVTVRVEAKASEI